MPAGTPRTDESRRERHGLMYGEAPPEERIGRSGGRRGVPRTEEERRAIHELYYGPGSSPPNERLGQGAGNSDPEWVKEWVAPGDDTLPAFLIPVAIPIIGGIKVGAAYVIVGAVAGIAGVVHAIDKWNEKRRRKKAGLPAQPQLEVTPYTDPKTGVPNFKFIITGTYPGRRIMLKIGKGSLYGFRDPIIGDRYGDGTIELSGKHLLAEAKAKKIIDIGMPTIIAGTKRIWIYAQESRPRLGDLRSPITLVEVEVKGVVGGVKEEIKEIKQGVAQAMLGFTILTPEQAKELIKAGTPCFIKSIFPIISMFPGLPYTPGMWIPWGCVLTDVQ